MSDQLEINAIPRDDLGKGASRRLRRLANLVPAIIYGAGKDPRPLSIVSKDLEKALENEAFFSQVIAVKIGSDTEKAILKDLQRHPAKELVMHADFLRIDEKVELKVNIPIHFMNEDSCKGVKLEGGVIEHQATEIELLCLPANIPEYIEIDMQDLSIGDSIHLSDVKLPEGTASVALSLGEDHDMPIAAVVAPRVDTEEEDDAEGEDAPAADEVPTQDDDEDGKGDE
ncbi:50S ribosomal protein L25/general stress protein Ctc [Chromatocurvus halotolerans]|uniref:Large ribosomal subunit protein bL25 n=1 Tax=Chromatocurvus halotolerans TaxID=1132028 RepID=A0A4R2KY67_9GAMM|nr:50S ribosomal protein L25/general stress protein Ctc [Chromatocurvus halotolerans]TCO76256.1 LSU ribosomal protein L25P [Chromatocurvus halotolerans]